MLDIRLIREKPDFVRERLATRGGGDESENRRSAARRCANAENLRPRCSS